MDLGGVRQKMARKNCELINAVKTVNGYVFFKRWYAVEQRVFFQRYGNFILTPTVYKNMHSYQVSRMLRGSHAILPYQSATQGSTTFLLLPGITESDSQVIRWAWRLPTVQWTEVGKGR